MERGRTANSNLGSVYLSGWGQQDCFRMLNVNGSSESLRPSSDVSLLEENETNFQTRDTLQSLVQSCVCGSRGPKLQKTSTGYFFDHTSKCKSMSESLTSSHKYKEVKYGCCSQFHQEKQPPVNSPKTTLIDSNNVVSSKVAKTNKKRIRWTEDLHKKFMDCVHYLGGAKKATPNGILKLMNSEGLTIFHVKSHLQKYRAPHHLMLEVTEGPGNTEMLDAKTGMQIVEALRIQLDVQRHLYEQLETQKKLQGQIEEQAKQLRAMIQSQRKLDN